MDPWSKGGFTSISYKKNYMFCMSIGPFRDDRYWNGVCSIICQEVIFMSWAHKNLLVLDKIVRIIRFPFKPQHWMKCSNSKIIFFLKRCQKRGRWFTASNVWDTLCLNKQNHTYGINEKREATQQAEEEQFIRKGELQGRTWGSLSRESNKRKGKTSRRSYTVFLE